MKVKINGIKYLEVFNKCLSEVPTTKRLDVSCRSTRKTAVTDRQLLIVYVRFASLSIANMLSKVDF